MFTGLIQKKGIITKLEKTGGSGSLVVASHGWDRPLALGESIAIQGVCLTVTKVEGEQSSFDVLGETFRCTNLGGKVVGQPVNMERALREGDALGGHMVQGHVDGVGRVRHIEPVDRDHRVEIDCPEFILHYVVFKGSIAVDGISLTVADVDEKGFTVHIIPHTWEVTTFGNMQEGDSLNLEADPLAKYVEQALRHGTSLQPIDWSAVRRAGYEQLQASAGPH